MPRTVLDETLAAMFSNPLYNSNYLFYAHIIGKCSIRIDETLPAAAGVWWMHDHYNIGINPKEFNKFKLEERLAVLKHEVLHIMFNHIDRIEDRTPKLWNYATDCAINQLIDKEHLPLGVITPDSLEQLLTVPVKTKESAEFYYNLLIDNKPKDSDKPTDSKDQMTTAMDTHDTWEDSTGDQELKKDITKKMIEKSQAETIKCKGKLPEGCQDWLNLHSTKSELNWKKVLRGIVGNKRTGKRSTIQRRDRRFPDRPDLRGKVKDRTFNLLVISDVSGSMSDDAILKTWEEVRHICDLTKTGIDLIQIDTKAYAPEKLTKRTKKVQRKGSGGTYLNAALDKAKEYNIDYQAVVVLTDGGLYSDDITYFQNLRKRVIWLIEPQGTILPEMNQSRMKAFQLKGDE